MPVKESTDDVTSGPDERATSVARRIQRTSLQSIMAQHGSPPPLPQSKDRGRTPSSLVLAKREPSVGENLSGLRDTYAEVCAEERARLRRLSTFSGERLSGERRGTVHHQIIDTDKLQAEIFQEIAGRRNDFDLGSRSLQRGGGGGGGRGVRGGRGAGRGLGGGRGRGTKAGPNGKKNTEKAPNGKAEPKTAANRQGLQQPNRRKTGNSKPGPTPPSSMKERKIAYKRGPTPKAAEDPSASGTVNARGKAAQSRKTPASASPTVPAAKTKVSAATTTVPVTRIKDAKSRDELSATVVVKEQTGSSGGNPSSPSSASHIGGKTPLKNVELTDQQIVAFRELFDLFDSNGGGTIDAEELDGTLRTVNICLSGKEVEDVLAAVDKDGKGAIDFPEFLQLMTNTERFVESLASSSETHGDRVKRENLLFEAVTEFMTKSSLPAVDELVGYYDTKYKRTIQAPHVVTHYAAGARLIGLTEKQIKAHIRRLNANNAEAGLAQNPYAIPLLLCHSHVEGQKGHMRLKVKAGSKMPPPAGATVSVAKVRRSKPRGWRSQRTDHIEVKLPPRFLQPLLPFDALTAEDLPSVRRQVTLASAAYTNRRRDSQGIRNLEHWSSLQAEIISPTLLRKHFRTVFCNYAAIEETILPPSKPTTRQPADQAEAETEAMSL